MLLFGVSLLLLVGVPLGLLTGVVLRLKGLFLSALPPAKSGLDCFLSVADNLLFCFLSTVLKLSCLSRSEDIVLLYFYFFCRCVLSSVFTTLSYFPAQNATLYK